MLLLLIVISVKTYMTPGREKMSETKIRLLAADDWESVRAIYLDGIATGQATFETEAPSWEAWDKNHLVIPRLVTVVNQRVVGWAALSAVSRRSVYAGVAETSVYVASYSRGRQVGRALLETLIAESERNGIWTLQASIFPENLASLHLHRSCGFRVVGTRERIGKLNGHWRDTMLLERRSKLVGRD
jgi:phosphinothricin acetyltransferase